MKKYPFQIINTELKGKRASLIGIIHETGFVDEYQDELSAIIEENDAIILEQPVDCEFWEGNQAYSKIAAIAHQKQKIVYQTDPSNVPLRIADLTASLAGLAILSKSGINLSKNLSRRQVLKEMLKIGAGTILAGSSLPLILAKSAVMQEVDTQYGIDNVLSYGTTDYRDLKMALGIEKIAQEDQQINRIVSIQGQAHVDPIKTYLTNSALKNKAIAYLPFDLLSKDKVRKYLPKQQGWSLEKEF